MFKQKHSINRHIKRWHKHEKQEQADGLPRDSVLKSMNEPSHGMETKSEVTPMINVLPQQELGAEFQTMDIQRALSLANPL